MYRSVRIKDHYAEQQMFLKRVILTGSVIAFAIILLIGRLIYLQVVKYDYYLDLSQGNRIRNEPLPPNRGLIFDRNGIALGLNAPSYQLEMTREQVTDVDAALKDLVALKLIDDSDVPALKKEIRGRRPFESIPLRLQLTEDELARFAVRRQDFPGIEIQPRITRYYPLGPSAVHALGYVSAISTEDQKTIDMDEYAGTTLMGKSGVERRFEKELHGQTGYQELLVNAQGRQVDRAGVNTADLKRRDPVAGNDLFLTIDQRVQQEAEKMLRGRRAAAVAIDPNNGDVLALVSTPGFDPNLFSRGISRDDYRELTTNEDIPLYNRALQGAHPSGSTIKPFMSLAALNYGIVTEGSTRYCGGAFRLPGVARPWRDFNERGHGYLSLRSAIEQSCDVYFYGVADALGIERIHDYLEPFGFGRAVGLDIGGEKIGILPNTEWKRRYFKQPWYPGETVNVGVGQGYLTVTPLQLAYGVSIIATRGQRFEPRLVRAVRDPTTGKISELPSRPQTPITVKDPSYWQIVTDGMVDVTRGSHGTARASGMSAQYTIAGKTGTAQVITVSSRENIKAATAKFTERQRDHGWFIGFAPSEKPTIALAVIVENGGQGGRAAAPVARRMLDAYLLSPEALKEQDAKGKSPGITTTDAVDGAD
jgi:penicillin-binding protein 2